MKKEIVVVSLQRLKTFLAQCMEKFALKDHLHNVATEQNDGFMSSNSVKDIEAIIAKLNNFGKLVDFDGGEPDNTEYSFDLDGGEPNSIYTLENPDFIVTLKAADWVASDGGGYVQSITNSQFSGLNDYFVASTLTGSETKDEANKYNAALKYIVSGSSSGNTITFKAIEKPSIDLSVKLVKV